MPNRRPRSPPTADRLGPATEPMVVAHTTTDSSRPRTCGGAPSVAAYRACRPAAVPPPNSVVATSSSQNWSVTAAATASTPPRRPHA